MSPQSTTRCRYSALTAALVTTWPSSATMLGFQGAGGGTAVCTADDGSWDMVRSGELGAAALGNQEPHREDVEHVERRKARDRGLARIGPCERTYHDGGKSVDAAADIGQHVLGRRARRGREQIAEQGAIATENAV